MTATSRQKLLTQKKSLVDQIKALNQKSAQAQINLMRAEADLKRVEKELVKAKPEFEITEHAILRYLERITGIDLEMIKAAILPADSVDKLAALGDGTHSLGEHSVVVKGEAIVTIVTPRITHY